MRILSFSFFLLLLGGGGPDGLAIGRFSCLPSSSQATKRALIIAIGNYPRTGGWAKLSSLQDAKLLEEALKAQGFQDIRLLQDKEATKKGIEEALQELIDKSQPGDIVYLHFSGHGQQVWDHESDQFPERKKDETDGFDESLVPYDARDEFRPGVYEGENHFLDDELHPVLSDLRRKIGASGQLIFTVDACYSGSISRAGGLLPVRGTSKKFSPGAIDAGALQSGSESAFSEAFAVDKVNTLADMLVFSAARADQPNYETLDESGQGVGSLSYALSRQLMQPFSSAPSFSHFFRQLEAEMAKLAPYQSPQLEGNGDKALFGGSIVTARGYPVLSFEDDRHCTIRGGELAGLYPGTVVRLQRSGSSSSDEKLKGSIIASEISRSTIELEQPISGANPADWVTTVESRMLAFSPVQIFLATNDEALSQLIQNQMEQSERLTQVDNGAQLLITRNETEGELILSDFNEVELGRYALSEGNEKAVSQLFQRIQDYTRAQYFRNFSSQAAGETVPVELLPIPVEIEQQGKQYVVRSRREDKLRADREVQPLEIGTPFIFKVTNKAPKPVYLSIIGVDAADEVFLLLPDARTPPAEFTVAADTTVYFSRPEHIFQISEPAGKQIFMAFASHQPVDLRPIFQYAGSGQPGAFRSQTTSQGQLLNELLFGNSRSGGLPSNDFIVSSVIVDIPEK